MAEKIPHRGRVQAQGGGTEKSEAWAQREPPTENDMLRICNRLEARLTVPEKKARAEAFSELRRFIHSAAKGGGVSAPVRKSFLNRGSKDIRVDLEVIKGKACVPDPQEGVES
jgi:hypothetical protein